MDSGRQIISTVTSYIDYIKIQICQGVKNARVL